MEKKEEGKKASAAQNGKSLSLCPIGTFRRAKGPPEDTYVMQKDRAVRMDSGKEGYVCFPCTGKKTGNKYICKLIKELEVAKWHVDELGNYKVPMEVASLFVSYRPPFSLPSSSRRLGPTFGHQI